MNLLTQDGFGIHTIELTLPHITGEQYAQIVRNIDEKDNTEFVRKTDTYSVLNTVYEGLRIYLGNNNYRNIRMIVNPKKILDPAADNVSIFSINDDIIEFKTRINEIISEVFGKGYNLDTFNLSRVDCCVNVMLPHYFSAERYVKLIHRSVNCKAKSIKHFTGDAPEAAARNKHSFRCTTKYGTFTAYDKYFQLDDIGADFDAISESLLRMELSFNRREIHRITVTYGEDAGIAEIFGLFLQNSREFFREFTILKFRKGNYYSVEKMIGIIKKSGLKKSEKHHMTEYVRMQCYYDDWQTLMRKSKKKLKSDKTFDAIMDNLEELNISPVSLSVRDKHGEDFVPGIYELLGFDEEDDIYE